MGGCDLRRLVATALLFFTACQPPSIVPTRKGELKLSTSATAEPLTEASHDFGLVRIGTSMTLEVTAKNVGRDTLTISQVTLEAADTGAFFVRGGTGRVEPNATTTCTVTFAPVRAGAQTARLVFEHDADAPLPALSMTGAGN